MKKLRKYCAERLALVASGNPLEIDDNLCAKWKAKAELLRRIKEESGPRADEARSCLKRFKVT